MAADLQEQVTKDLTDAHSIEAQALTLLSKAPRLAGDGARGALNWGLFFRVQPDTPHKLAAFAYAFDTSRSPATRS